MGRFFKRLTSIVVSLTLCIIVSMPNLAGAADLSGQYSWNRMKIGGGGMMTGAVIHPTSPGLVYTRCDVAGAYKWNTATNSWDQLLTKNSLPSSVITTEYPEVSGAKGIFRSRVYGVEALAIDPSDPNVLYVSSSSSGVSGSVALNEMELITTDSGIDTDRTNEAGGTVTARANPTTYPMPNAFDNTNKYWVDNLSKPVIANPAWIEYAFAGSGYAITKYTLTSIDVDTRQDPADWVLKGSNSDTNWAGAAVLDTKVGQAWLTTERNVKKTFTISNSTVYKYYRLEITANSGQENNLLFKSTNKGTTFTLTNFKAEVQGNGAYRGSGERMMVDPGNSNVMYYGTVNQGLWVSTNAGIDWNRVPVSKVPAGVNIGTDEAGVLAVAFDPTAGKDASGKTKRIYVSVAGTGIYKTEDAGNNWSNISTGTNAPAPEACALHLEVSQGALFPSLQKANSTSYQGVKKYSPVGGWVDISPTTASVDIYNVTVDPNNSQRIYAADGYLSAFYRSTNGGTSWTTLSSTYNEDNAPWRYDYQGYSSNNHSFKRIIFDPQVYGRMWCPEGFGVYQVNGVNDTTSSIQFTNISQGIEAVCSTDVIAPPGGKPITTYWDLQGTRHNNLDANTNNMTVNGKFALGFSANYCQSQPNFITTSIYDFNYPYGAQSTYNFSGYSTDGGQTWTKFPCIDNGTIPTDLKGGDIAISATNSDHMVWLPNEYKLPYYSADRGTTWNPIPFFNDSANGQIGNTPHYNYKHALTADGLTGDTFYMAMWGPSKIVKSVDGGLTWSNAGATLPGLAYDATLKAVPGRAGHLWYSTGPITTKYAYNLGLFYSFNAGATMTQVPAIQQCHCVGFGKAAVDGGYPTIYIYGMINNQWGVYRSTDQGSTWDYLTDYPTGNLSRVISITGDMDTFGKVYLGLGGNGFAYGMLPTPTPSPTPTPIPTLTLMSQGKPVMASSYSTGNEASHANDGNVTATPWGAFDGVYPQFWEVDLGASYNLSQVKGYWGSPTTRAYKYKIELSNDDLNFTTVIDNTGNTTNGNTVDNFSAAGRYVRVTVTGCSASGGYANANEFQVYASSATPIASPTTTPILLSQSRTVTASTNQTGYEPYRANDGNLTSTAWTATSGSYPQWWKVDLGNSYSLSQVKGFWGAPTNRAYKYKIELSNDDVNYTTVIDNTGNTTFGNTVDNFSASGRYVRITVTGCTTAGGYASAFEFQVFGTPPPPSTISQGKTVTASSYSTGNDPNHAIDGQLTATPWTATDGSYPQWWKVDLGTCYNLTQVKGFWSTPATRGYKYKIDVSSDDVNYSCVVDRTGNMIFGNTVDCFSTIGRYVKITVTGCTTAGGYASANEFQVVGY